MINNQETVFENSVIFKNIKPQLYATATASATNIEYISDKPLIKGFYLVEFKSTRTPNTSICSLIYVNGSAESRFFITRMGANTTTNATTAQIQAVGTTLVMGVTESTFDRNSTLEFYRIG